MKAKEIKDITYDIPVDYLEMTCSSCPSQWEGLTKGGNELYIRLRGGIFRVYVDWVEVLQFKTDAFDMTTEEMMCFLDSKNVILK